MKSLPSLVFLFLLFYFSVTAQAQKPSVSAEPSWITKNVIDYNKTILDEDAEDGYIDISFEIQVSLAENTEYFRCSKKIISQAGIQNGSEVSVSFDPSYEKLSFHSIRIIRDGESINKLELSKFKTLHQEQELRDFIYNGTMNSVLILEDVRQGDIIEYSYSVKGFNPIFKNKYSRTFSLGYSVPVYDLYYKLIVPAGRTINVKTLKGNTKAEVKNSPEGQLFEWHKKNVPASQRQDYTPSWFDFYEQIMISEYNSWKEVSDWAMELFPANISLSAALQKKISDIKTTYPSEEERTAAALRFVQDDVRYMGIEMGVNSHKPVDPSKIFSQRFGDCKEKSYLLCAMLHAMNIEAEPVLINTSAKKSLFNYLPAPVNFDHVTARVKLNGNYYWFDPTIAYQRGNIKNIFYPDYQAGLIISAQTTALTSIPFRNNSEQKIEEIINIPSMFGGATMMVVTKYSGSDADKTRDNFHSNSIKELMKEYQKFYAVYYPDIIVDSLKFADNDTTGIFTTTEYYSIPNLWKVNKNSSKTFSFSAFAIDNNIRKPKDHDRSMPFTLYYPVKIEENVTVELPEEWNVTESELEIKNTCFAYNSRFLGLKNKVYMQAKFENLKDFTAPEESKKYFEDVKEYEEQAGFEITSGGEITAGSNNKRNTGDFFPTVLVVGLCIGGAVWWSQRK